MAEYIAPIQRLVEEFRRLPGVGAKTAARIILELQDKLMKETPAEILTGGSQTAYIKSSAANKGVLSEAQDALTVLGYTRNEAISALQGIDPTLDLEEIIISGGALGIQLFIKPSDFLLATAAKTENIIFE